MNYTTPQGFRDVLADEAIEREAIARRVQDLFARAGYVPIETPTLERMPVMQAESAPSAYGRRFEKNASRASDAMIAARTAETGAPVSTR